METLVGIVYNNQAGEMSVACAADYIESLEHQLLSKIR